MLCSAFIESSSTNKKTLETRPVAGKRHKLMPTHVSLVARRSDVMLLSRDHHDGILAKSSIDLMPGTWLNLHLGIQALYQ
jgi:hypothetical protein